MCFSLEFQIMMINGRKTLYAIPTDTTTSIIISRQYDPFGTKIEQKKGGKTVFSSSVHNSVSQHFLISSYTFSHLQE